MNRKQRRAAEKQMGCASKVRNTPVKPIAPLAPLDIEALKARHPELTSAIDRFEVNCKLDAANEIFNLVFSAVLISLHDKYDFNADQLNHLISYAVNHIDCVKSGFVTDGDLMLLVEELGVIVAKLDYSKILHTAQQTNDRLKVYFEEVEAMNNMEKSFKLFDKGVTDSKVVAEKLGVKVSTIYKYKQMWNKSKIEDMTPEQFADKLFGGEDEVKKVKDTVKKAIDLEKPVVEVTPEQAVEELKEVVEEIKKEEVAVMEENKVVEAQKKVLDIPAKGRKFEVKRTVEIEAEFGAYTIVGNVAEVMLETREMGLTKADLLAFAEELQAVACEM